MKKRVPVVHSLVNKAEQLLQGMPVYRVCVFEEMPATRVLDPSKFQIATIGRPATEHLLYNPNTKMWASFASREKLLVALAYQNESKGSCFKVVSPLGQSEKTKIFSVDYSNITLFGFKAHRHSPKVKAISEADFRRSCEMQLFESPSKAFDQELKEIKSLVEASKTLPESKIHRAISLGLSIALHLYYTPFSIGLKGLITGLDALVDCLPKESSLAHSIREFTTCFQVSQPGGAARYAVSSSLAFLVIRMEKLLGKKFPDELRQRFVLLGAMTYDLVQNPLYVQKSAEKDGVQCVSHELSGLGLEAHSLRCQHNGQVYYEFQLVSSEHGVVCRYTEKTTPTGPVRLPSSDGSEVSDSHVESLLYVKKGFDFHNFVSKAKVKASGCISEVFNRISECIPSASTSAEVVVYLGVSLRTRPSVVSLLGGAGLWAISKLPTLDALAAKPSTEVARRQFTTRLKVGLTQLNQNEFASSPYDVRDHTGGQPPQVIIFAEEHHEEKKASYFFGVISGCSDGGFPIRLWGESCLAVEGNQAFFPAPKRIKVTCWDDSGLKKSLEILYTNMNSQLKDFCDYLGSVPQLVVFKEKLAPFLTTSFYEPALLREEVVLIQTTYHLRGLTPQQLEVFVPKMKAFLFPLKAYFEGVVVSYSKEGMAQRDAALTGHIKREKKENPDGISVFTMGYNHAVAATKQLKELGMRYLVVYSSRGLAPQEVSIEGGHKQCVERSEM